MKYPITKETIAIIGSYLFSLGLFFLGMSIYRNTDNATTTTTTAKGSLDSIAECLTPKDIAILEDCDAPDLFGLIDTCGTPDMIERIEKCELY